jgi:hypothetical protein
MAAVLVLVQVQVRFVWTHRMFSCFSIESILFPVGDVGVGIPI